MLKKLCLISMPDPMNAREVDIRQTSIYRKKRPVNFVLNVLVISFVNAVGLEAEKMDHHPDILMFAWSKVKITISTHSAGGVTDKDFSLAHKIEERKK